jgi:ribokinase
LHRHEAGVGVKTAVVGHVEWNEFALVDHVPRPGEIVRVHETFSEPAGGGAVAAVQLARLAGECTFYTALGDDEIGERSRSRLHELGVRVEAAVRRGAPTRRAFTYLDASAERTITVIGDRLHPCRSDDLPWDELADIASVYFCAGDPDALRAARATRALVATARVLDTLEQGHVELDALVGSAHDPKEQYTPGQLDPPPRLVVVTAGAEGGTWTGVEGRTGHWAAAPLPGPMADSYGAGDSFAAGLAFALGDGRGPEEALELAARCGAMCMTGHGPYERQLRR